MIHFGDTPFRPAIQNAVHCCLACRRMLLTLPMVAALAPLSASGCDGDLGCGDLIDSFFLPLIANSLADDPRTAAGATMPVPLPLSMPDTRLPDEPVIIRPPPRPPSETAKFLPALRIEMTQQIVASGTSTGGRADLKVGHGTTEIPVFTTKAATRTAPTPAIPPLQQEKGSASIWRMQHTVVLPMHAGWPIGRLQQPVTMRMTCGACGKDGGVAHFTGSAQFEIEFDLLAEGWIEEIDLISEEGLRASGQISFWDEWPSRNLALDHKAVMVLQIDDREADMGGSLATWFGPDKRAAGIFTANQIDGADGFSGIAGQFRGAPCTPPCGVEN